jgi:DNA-binding HxlR family transcriptional regulator
METMKREYDESNMMSCPVAGIQRIINGKWSMVIVYYLSEGTLRFGELSKKMPQVTQANLTKELRALEEYGLIHREVYREVPPKVEYSLTEIGRKFMPVIEALEAWAIEYKQSREGVVI